MEGWRSNVDKIRPKQNRIKLPDRFPQLNHFVGGYPCKVKINLTRTGTRSAAFAKAVRLTMRRALIDVCAKGMYNEISSLFIHSLQSNGKRLIELMRSCGHRREVRWGFYFLPRKFDSSEVSYPSFDSITRRDNVRIEELSCHLFWSNFLITLMKLTVDSP